VYGTVTTAAIPSAPLPRTQPSQVPPIFDTPASLDRWQLGHCIDRGRLAREDIVGSPIASRGRGRPSKPDDAPSHTSPRWVRDNEPLRT
jgi:hypothetical protein